MKKIISLFLCIIIPFCLIIPTNSFAFDVQGTEYAEPGLLPPDFDFSGYDYYFLTVSGTPENPRYYLYVVKDKANTGRLYFSVTKELASTKIHNGSFTSYEITTNYEVQISSYNSTNGTFGSFGTPNSSALQNFAFDGYSDFSASSSAKYIIGCNTDIYSYFGVNVRSGDYDDLNLFFLGGLKGTSDRTESPSEPATSGGGSESGGNVVVDLGDIPATISAIYDGISSLLEVFTSIPDSIGSLADSVGSLVNGDSSSDGSIFLHLSVIKNTLVDFLNSTNTKLDEIKQEILNFERYFSEFSAINGEIANLFSVLGGYNKNVVNIHTRLIEIKEIIEGMRDNVSDISNNFTDFLLHFPADFDDIIRNIRDNVSNISSSFTRFLLYFPSDFGDIISNIKDNVSNISNGFTRFLLYFPSDFGDIIRNIRDNVSNISNSFTRFLLSFSADSFFSDIKFSIDNLFEDISLKIGNLTDSEIISAIKSVDAAVTSLPEKFRELLTELFVPTTTRPQEIMNIIEEKFGFVGQIAEMSDAIFDENNFSNELPDYTFEINSDLFGHFEGKIIDFSVIPYEYIIWFKCLVSGITCYFFIQKVRKRIPAIINGEVAP